MTLASFNNTLAVTVDQNLNPNLALPKKKQITVTSLRLLTIIDTSLVIFEFTPTSILINIGISSSFCNL